MFTLLSERVNPLAFTLLSECIYLTVLTAVKVNVIVLCNAHTRGMLLSLPAAAACLLLLCHPAAVLHKCNWSGYVITR